MSQKIEKATSNVIKLLHTFDNFLLKCGNKIL